MSMKSSHVKGKEIGEKEIGSDVLGPVQTSDIQHQTNNKVSSEVSSGLATKTVSENTAAL